MDMGLSRDGEKTLKIATWVWPALFALGCLGLGVVLDFQQFHNDFWDVVFVARHLDLADARTFFNPQVPVGSAIFLRMIMGSGSPVIPAILANIAFAAATLLLCGRGYLKSMPTPFALASLILLSLFPTFSHYANVGGGDPGSVLLFTAGALLALRELESGAGTRSRRLFVAGLLLGLAGLFRYHALVAGGILWVALTAAYPARWKSLLLTGAGLCVGFCPQWIVNLASGHGLMETRFGPMNVYFLMHGINWQRFSELKLQSVPQIIAADPGLFLRKYAASLWSFKQAWAPPLLALFLARDPALRRRLLAIALWSSLYFLLFSATTSGRQILLALPLSMLSLGIAAWAAWDRFKGLSERARVMEGATGRASILVAGALLLAFYAYRDVRFSLQRAGMRDDAVAVESWLKASGVVRADQVFTSDFDLYFRTLEGSVPRFNGGAPRQGTYLYNELQPEFPADALDAFVEACRTRGVRYVVLNADCPKLSPAFADFCRERSAGSASTEGLKRVAEIGRYDVYGVR